MIVPEHANGVIAIFSALLFVATTLYTVFAALQWSANKKAADAAKQAADTATQQTALMKQQLEGTASAIVTFQEPRITNDQLTGNELLVILLSNQGHVIAPNVHASLEIDTVGFPELTTVLESRTETVVVPQIDAGKSWGENYDLPTFTRPELKFATQRKTITVKGAFEFENGFGKQFEKPFCYSYIGLYNIKNPEGIAGSTSGGGGFLPCDRFRELVSYVLKRQLK